MSVVADDAVLVARSKLRDAPAFGALVDRHHRLVFGVALATCGDPSLAEDLAQDAFVAAWRDLDRLRDAGRVGSWIAGIARNLARVAVRERARGHDQPSDVERVRTPEDEVLDREDRELLRSALARLREPHREALVLYYVEGQSIARIADALHVGDDVVKKRLSRGRKALRDSLVRVEAALTRIRPNAAIPATVLAAITTLGGRKAMAAPSSIGKVIGMMSVKTKVAVAATLILAASASWLGVKAHSDARARGESKPSVAALDHASGASKQTPDRVSVRRIQNLAQRPALLEQIRKAAQQRSQPSRSTRAAPSADSSPPTYDDSYKEYVESAAVEIVPLLEECFTQGLERNPKFRACTPRPKSTNPNDPDFSTDCQVTVSMTIEGEPGVGGLVTQSAVDATESNVNDPDAVECIEQTMYSLEIGPPPIGGTVETRLLVKIGMDAPGASQG